MHRLTLHWFLPVYSHHRAVADAISGLECDLAHGTVVGGTWVGIGNGVWVDSGTVSVSLFTSDVVVLVERLLGVLDEHLGGYLSNSLDGDFNFEGLLHGASLGDFLGNLDDDFVYVGSGDLYLVLFFSHFGVFNVTGNLLLFALVNNLDCELRLDGASASGSGTAAAALALAAAIFLSARADNFFGNRDFLPDLLAGGLELTNGTGPDLWDLTSPGHSVHDDSGLFDCLVDHDGLGENFFNRAHLNLLLELLVTNFC